MPKKAKDKIGEKVTTTNGITWTIVEELERGMSKDRYNGYEDQKPHIRRFKLICDRCGYEKNANYKNIFHSKNVVCNVCEKKTVVVKEYKKSELVKIDDVNIPLKYTKDGKIDRRSVRPNNVEYIGMQFQCTFDKFLVIKELPRVLSKNGKNIYRNFLVKCLECDTEKEALAASLLAKGVACPQCRTQKRKVVLTEILPPPDLERKIEIIHEINQIWEDMKRMQRAGILNQYLMDKFDATIYENEPIEPLQMVDDSDSIDYGNIDIDWDQEINNFL